MSPVSTCFYLTFLAAVFIQGRDGINDRPKRPEIDDCDFDDDRTPLCHWENTGTELSFTRHSGNTMSHSTGPDGDHSRYKNGSYIYLESSNVKFGERARITSKRLEPTVGRTLRFYANMYGSTVNYLRVFIQKRNQALNELWKMSGNQGKKWIEVKLRIVSLVPYQITFEAAVGRNFQSDIAIDDITFIDGLYQVTTRVDPIGAPSAAHIDKPIRTGWSQWNSWTTCQVKNNWCRRERFRLCIMSGEKGCAAQAGENLQREVASCDGSHCRVDGHWSSWSLWSSCLSPCGSGKRWRTRQCNEPAPQFGGRTCAGTATESVSCWSGFCNSGTDDCDFDDDANPFCTWTNSNNSLQFHRKYLWTGTAGTGPPGDHSNNTQGKYIYLESSSPAKHGQYARLISGRMKPTRSRSLKFFAYMHGKSVNNLRVLIRTENATREIWRLGGNHGKKWMLGRVDYSCPVPYQIIFEAAVGKTFQSDIAIDTIHFEEAKISKKTEKSTFAQKINRSNVRGPSRALLCTVLVTCIFLIYQPFMQRRIA